MPQYIHILVFFIWNCTKMLIWHQENEKDENTFIYSFSHPKVIKKGDNLCLAIAIRKILCLLFTLDKNVYQIKEKKAISHSTLPY